MTPQEIKDALKECDITQTSIADELGVRQPAVNQVIHKRQTSRRIQEAICKAISKEFNEVWG